VDYFRAKFIDQLGMSCNVTFTFFLIIRWVCLYLDLICIAFTLLVASFTVWAKDKIDKEILALSMQVITDVIVFFGNSIRVLSEIENMMTSSQRIFAYTQMDKEDELKKDHDHTLPEWPSKGEIEFKNVTMSYREGLEPSLRGLSFKVEGGMKIGIVGRTGAGKSSIIQTLFRLCDPSNGEILIDNQNINEVGLHLLRKNIAFIP
jgi:ATP-binding cassette subfamily C (CFTR/MRP) protein 4